MKIKTMGPSSISCLYHVRPHDGSVPRQMKQEEQLQDPWGGEKSEPMQIKRDLD